VKRTKSLKNQSLDTAIASQTTAFSVTGETRKLPVQNRADEVVDCVTDVDQQWRRIDRPDVCRF